MLSVKDKRIIEFYKTHSYIDFEQANLLLVEMLERLLQKNDDNRDDIFSVNFVSSAVSSRNLAVQCFEDFSSSPFSTICRFCIKIPSFEILFNARSIL